MADEYTRGPRYSSETEIRAIQIQFDHLEQKVEALSILATSVNVLAESIQRHGYVIEQLQKEMIEVNEHVIKNQTEILNIRLEPANKWALMKDRVLWVIVGAILLGIVNSILKGVFL